VVEQPVPVGSGHEIQSPPLVNSVSFSADGRTMVTGNIDGTVGFWDTTDPYRPPNVGVLATGSAQPTAVATLAGDRRGLATVGADGAIRLWDTADVRNPVLLATVTDGAGRPSAISLALSPDGQVMATGRVSTTARLWDVADPRHPKPLAALSGLAGSVYSMAFSGHALVTATDTAVQIWDVRNPRHAVRTAAITNTGGRRFHSVALRPDGRVLATAHFDHTVDLWEIGDTAEPRLLAGLPSTGVVYSVAFSPDGHLLAAGNADRTVNLWDTTDYRHPLALATLRSATATHTVAFSPRNGILASAGADMSVPGSLPHLWDMDVDRIEAHICQLAWPGITSEEWDRHLPGLDYRPPCPR
jgi:WD40 repeat protein